MKFKEYIGLIKRLLRDNVSNSDVLDLLFRYVIDKYKTCHKNRMQNVEDMCQFNTFVNDYAIHQ